MALIYCPECGRQVSDKAPTCPQCGYPISSAAQDINPIKDTPEKKEYSNYILRIHRPVQYVGGAVPIYCSINHKDIGKVLIGGSFDYAVGKEPFVLEFLGGGSIKGIFEFKGSVAIEPTHSPNGLIDVKVKGKIKNIFKMVIDAEVSYK